MPRGSLEALGADISALRCELELELGPRVTVATPRNDEDPPAATDFQDVVERAVVHCHTTQRAEIRGTNILVALFSPGSFAVKLIERHGLTRFSVVEFLYKRSERDV